MSINAQTIDWYMWLPKPWHPLKPGKETEPLIVRLAGILDQLEPQGDDNLHIIWIKARRPTFRQYYDQEYGYDEPFKNADPKTLNRAREDYRLAYPVTYTWYQLGIRHFSRSEDEEFYALFLDDSYVFGINDCNSRETIEGTDLLTWAISEAEAFVREVRAGTVEQNILQNVPLIYRKGTVRRGDLWEACPDLKKKYLKNYKMREVRKFISYYRDEPSSRPGLLSMTARTFYEACGVVYTSLGLHRDGSPFRYTETDEERLRYNGAEQTPKEMYYLLADGRDNGLKNVPMDDPDAFDEWKAEKGPYFEFNGSHPWEIIPL